MVCNAESEKTVEAYLRERMKGIGGKAYKFVSPGTAGVPDRLCVFPDGRIAFAELKGTGGRLTTLQQRQIQQLQKLGCDVAVLKSKADVDKFIDERT